MNGEDLIEAARIRQQSVDIVADLTLEERVSLLRQLRDVLHPDQELYDRVDALLAEGQYINAIKRWRAETGDTLRVSKERVDYLKLIREQYDD